MKIHVRVPATTANLGPGFDALGLALDLWNEAVFQDRDGRDFSVSFSIEGEGADSLPTDAGNPIAEAALQIWRLAQKPARAFHVHCVNRIPLGSGLGSSSAAMLTGMLGANALLGNPFTNEEILKLAIETEEHPDNVAPAMLGGLVASIVYAGRVISIKLPALANRRPVHATVVLPDFDFPTREARAILPQQVSRSDAIYNISRAVMVTEALRTGDLELLGKAMWDRLHQPYRVPLIPGAQAAMEEARRAGAPAVALSGAGPSLIAFTARRVDSVGAAMRRAFEEAGMRTRVFNLTPTSEGASTVKSA
jgi:homoserine kinase